MIVLNLYPMDEVWGSEPTVDDTVPIDITTTSSSPNNSSTTSSTSKKEDDYVWKL